MFEFYTMFRALKRKRIILPTGDTHRKTTLSKKLQIYAESMNIEKCKFLGDANNLNSFLCIFFVF